MRVQEIVAFTKRMRGEEGRFRRTILGDKGATVKGLCCQIGRVTDVIGGDVWRSNLAKDNPGQVWPGHSVGIIQTRGKAGVVVDFTSREIITGQVRDVTKERVVRAALQKIYGAAGWRKNIKLTDEQLKEYYGI